MYKSLFAWIIQLREYVTDFLQYFLWQSNECLGSDRDFGFVWNLLTYWRLSTRWHRLHLDIVMSNNLSLCVRLDSSRDKRAKRFLRLFDLGIVHQLIPTKDTIACSMLNLNPTHFLSPVNLIKFSLSTDLFAQSLRFSLKFTNLIFLLPSQLFCLFLMPSITSILLYRKDISLAIHFYY